MSMEAQLPSPTKRYQELDNLEAFMWHPQPLNLSKDPMVTLSPDELLFQSYDSIPYNSESWMDQDLLSPMTPISPTSAPDRFDIPAMCPDIMTQNFDDYESVSGRSDSLLASPDLSPKEHTTHRYSRSDSRRNSLSPEEIANLWAIAMPDLTTSTGGSSTASSPEAEPNTRPVLRKRPSNQPQHVTAKAKASPPKHQIAHNLIEKRYRNNLNSKIAALRNSVPSLRAKKDGTKSDDSAPLSKINKATILTKATEYISHLETLTRSLAEKNATLRSRTKALEDYIARNG